MYVRRCIRSNSIIRVFKHVQNQLYASRLHYPVGRRVTIVSGGPKNTEASVIEHRLEWILLGMVSVIFPVFILRDRSGRRFNASPTYFKKPFRYGTQFVGWTFSEHKGKLDVNQNLEERVYAGVDGGFLKESEHIVSPGSENFSVGSRDFEMEWLT